MSWLEEKDYTQKNPDKNLNDSERRTSRNIVVWECPTNRHYRVYRTRKLLTTQDFGDGVSRGLLAGFDKTPSELCIRIADVEGTESVNLRGYEASVTKAAAFEWSEIEPEILLVLESVFA